MEFKPLQISVKWKLNVYILTNINILSYENLKAIIYIWCVNINTYIMKATLNFRSVVFKKSYYLWKDKNADFAEAIKEAWNRYRQYRDKLVSDLATQINRFDFNYHYSDDRRVYRHWSDAEMQILELLTVNRFVVRGISTKISDRKLIHNFINS